MRSWRYKQRRAHDAVTAHNYGESLYGGWYPMQSDHDFHETFYSLKNDEWWQTIYRKA